MTPLLQCTFNSFGGVCKESTLVPGTCKFCHLPMAPRARVALAHVREHVPQDDPGGADLSGDRGGATYEHEHDYERLNKQMRAVYEVMKDGAWHTLEELAATAGALTTSVSARLRDFRKEEYGSWQVDRRRVAGGLHEYRLHR